MSVIRNMRKIAKRKLILYIVKVTTCLSKYVYCSAEGLLKDREEAWNKIEKLALQNPQVKNLI